MFTKSTLLLAVVLHVTNVVPETTLNPDSLACGPNAVLLFLELCGNCSTGDFRDEIVCGPTGASMLQLKEVCRNHGEQVQVRSFNYIDARDMPLPAIWQVRRYLHPHFIVVYSLSKDHVHALDGTDGREIRIPFDRVEGFFTGNAIVREQSACGKMVDWARKIANTYWITAAEIVAIACLSYFPKSKGKTD